MSYRSIPKRQQNAVQCGALQLSGLTDLAIHQHQWTWKNIPTMWGPLVISWFITPVTIVISTINHSYCMSHDPFSSMGQEALRPRAQWSFDPRYGAVHHQSSPFDPRCPATLRATGDIWSTSWNGGSRRCHWDSDCRSVEICGDLWRSVEGLSKNGEIIAHHNLKSSDFIIS